MPSKTCQITKYYLKVEPFSLLPKETQKKLTQIKTTGNTFDFPIMKLSFV